ncbi:MAG: hypothetical protein WCF59_01450, partial [Desulfobaccales bacterium]
PGGRAAPSATVVCPPAGTAAVGAGGIRMIRPRSRMWAHRVSRFRPEAAAAKVAMAAIAAMVATAAIASMVATAATAAATTAAAPG